MSERTHDRLGVALRRVLGVHAHVEAPRDLDARLDAIERDVAEVRTRVNALFFAVISVAIGDLVVRAVHP